MATKQQQAPAPPLATIQQAADQVEHADRLEDMAYEAQDAGADALLITATRDAAGAYAAAIDLLAPLPGVIDASILPAPGSRSYDRAKQRLPLMLADPPRCHERDKCRQMMDALSSYHVQAHGLLTGARDLANATVAYRDGTLQADGVSFLACLTRHKTAGAARRCGDRQQRQDGERRHVCIETAAGEIKITLF